MGDLTRGDSLLSFHPFKIYKIYGGTRIPRNLKKNWNFWDTKIAFENLKLLSQDRNITAFPKWCQIPIPLTTHLWYHVVWDDTISSFWYHRITLYNDRICNAKSSGFFEKMNWLCKGDVTREKRFVRKLSWLIFSHFLSCESKKPVLHMKKRSQIKVSNVSCKSF